MQPKSYKQIRNELKVLLFQFARESDQPGRELQEVLREVINELHAEVKEVTEKNGPLGLKLVATGGAMVQ